MDEQLLAIYLTHEQKIIGPFKDPKEVHKWLTDNRFKCDENEKSPGGYLSRYRGSTCGSTTSNCGIEVYTEAHVCLYLLPTENWLNPDTMLPVK